VKVGGKWSESRSCPMAGFGTSEVESSGSITRQLVGLVVNQLDKKQDAGLICFNTLFSR